MPEPTNKTELDYDKELQELENSIAPGEFAEDKEFKKIDAKIKKQMDQLKKKQDKLSKEVDDAMEENKLKAENSKSVESESKNSKSAEPELEDMELDDALKELNKDAEKDAKKDAKKEAELDTLLQNKNRLEFYQGEIDKFKTPPTKPGWLANLWNNFQKIFTGSDIGSIKAYNHYTNAQKKVAELKEKITKAEKRLGKSSQEGKKINKPAAKKVKSAEKLAEHIVRESMKYSKDAVPELSGEKFEKQVNKVMRSKEFKAVMSDLKVSKAGVKPADFHKAYMKKMAQTQKKANQKTKNAPKMQKVKNVNKNKVNEKPHLPGK